MVLKNIIRVEVADASSVAASFIQQSLTECSVGSVEWEELDIEVPARMTVESRVKDKEPLADAELVFRSCRRLCQGKPVCLRLTLRDGSKMILGDGKRPHVTMGSSEVHPDNVADSQLIEYIYRRTSKTGPLTVR